MNKTEKKLFDAVKNHGDEMARSMVSLFAAPDKEFEPDAEVPNLNLQDESGFTLMHYAVKRGLRSTVSRLLEEGAAVDTKDKTGNTPLVLAIKELPVRKINDSDVYSETYSENYKIVQKLVEYKADITAIDTSEYADGYTCLHLAVSQNNYLTLRALLEKKSDPAKLLEVTDKMGLTPLHLAALKGDIDMVGYMLEEAKANPNFQSPTLGYNALHFAVNGNKPIVVPLLLKAGADPLMGTTRDPRHTPLVMAQKMNNKEVAAAIEKETTKSTSSFENNSRENFSTPFQSEVKIATKPFISSPMHTTNSNNSINVPTELQKALKDGGIEEYIKKGHAALEQLKDLHQKSPRVIDAMRCYNIRQGIYKQHITVEQLGKLTEQQIISIEHKFNDSQLKLKVESYIEDNERMSKIIQMN